MVNSLFHNYLSVRKLILDIAHEGHLRIEKLSNLLVLVFIGQACDLI